jgi:cyclopropane fatty-acyl-phospholipid synthase-like methyltransferase
MDRFDRLYEGKPRWDIGRPQAAIVELAKAGRFHGRVLDLGCGTGENAIYLAARGCKVVGVDGARAAIASAQRKAGAQGVAIEFLVHDALSVSALGATFDAVLDSGFFHTLGDDGRLLYKEELTLVMAPGASLSLLCFSEREPDWGGPRRVREEELRDLFQRPFFIESLERTQFETTSDEGSSHAWLASITYIGQPRAMLS